MLLLPIFAIVNTFYILFFRMPRDPKKKRPSLWYSYPKVKPFVPLPKDDIGLPNVVYGCGGKDSSPRQVDDIQLHAIGWRRHESLNILLQQLENADYGGWHKDVPLYIHIDGGSNQTQVNNMASNFKWTHGPQHVEVQQENVGLRTMWLDSLGLAARKAGNNTLLVVFEDDVRVAPTYFQWLLATVDTYARTPQCRDSNLVGFSLSPILLSEMSKPFKKWDARQAMGERSNDKHRHLAYLSVVPSSWGGAYWSDQWNDFDKFVRHRMQPPFFDMEAEKVPIKDYGELRLTPKELYIPGARSNFWPKSWKRFMVDFMYARGLVMLYPNLIDQKGFATALQESGEHVQNGVIHSKNPRVADLLNDKQLNLTAMGNLPRYGDLIVFDLTFAPTTREKLVEEGTKFLNDVWEKCMVGCGDLVRLWGRPGANISGVRKDGKAPQICVPDLYTPVSAARTRPVPSSSERYLLFEPQYGANNQLHAIVEAYYWARALGRRLVLPPIIMPRVSALEESTDVKWLPAENFFHISDADKPELFTSNSKVNFDTAALEPIGFAEFATRNVAPWRLIRGNRDALFDKPGRILTTALGKNGNLDLINLRHLYEKSVSVEKVQQQLGGCDDEVLAFDGLYFANLNGVRPRELMPDVMTLSEETEEVYRSVKNKFVDEFGAADYGCYHVRLGDFTEMCKELENPAEGSKLFPSSYLRTAQEFACSVTPEELVIALEENGYPAFIMSDNAKKLDDALTKVTLKTLTSDWVAQAVRESIRREISSSDLQLFSLIIDQELCSDAKLAVLNRFSTVSQRVISLRRGKDYKYWKRLDRNPERNIV